MSAEGIEIAPEINYERLERYLEEGKRFDGRTPGQFRDLVIEKGVSKKAEGSVRVKLGDTEVIVGVKVAIGEPYPDSQDKGNLMVTAEMSPLSSPRIELGPPKFPAIELGRVIDRGIRESHVIDLKKLCIKEGEKVWTVFIDIYAMNDDGNLLDAAGIGALAALKVAKLPKYDEKEDKILYDQPDIDMPLTGVNPIAITVHRVGDSLLVDPTREEEDLSKTRLTIGISDGRISSMQKGDSGTLTAEEIDKAVEMAEDAWKELFKKLEKQVK
jgi:exosome complex component RRP42